MSAYVLGRKAEDDLRAILGYVRRHDGLARAVVVHDAFVEAFELIAASPMLGVRSGLMPEQYRRWRVYNYLVFYNTQSEPLRITRIVHGARDLPRILGED